MKIPCSHLDRPRAGYGACQTCYSRWYRSTPRGYELGRKARRKYNKTAKGQTAQKKWNKKYQKSEAGIAAHRQWWWKKIGIDPSFTYEQYMIMEKAQDGLCTICRGTTRGKRLNVDHNHKTGKVRGLICSVCNHKYIAMLDKMLEQGILGKALLHIGCGESAVRMVIADLIKEM